MLRELPPEYAVQSVLVSIWTNLGDVADTTTSFIDRSSTDSHIYAPDVLLAVFGNIAHSTKLPVVEGIPPAILANWDALRRSQLSSKSLECLIFSTWNRPASNARGLKPVTLDSLRNFLRFWSNINADSAEPEISVSPRGFVQAEWFKDDDHFLVIEFRPDDSLMFSLWDEAPRVEGMEILSFHQDLERMLRVRADNPFLWSE